ncbi:unnamed protein product (macronuclear) [Paramecium tetraurelia]|uniref:Transmembrane protein n=1 Tax=Paramecium tetraurelia TaxID=5888 RepID=A0DV46_PARTE|nr:uncharacterized protein GSPATT00020575001 [Paramecium tetraurelia]CAK86913.1 unnamed protein product [Paramecium tetraurelia]|eukprot:XP_001454310.1 hypothetical protein (macronuclear) [Paramecium tetraurelia strain d4-2]
MFKKNLFFFQLFVQLLDFENKAYKLPEHLVNILLLQHSLINISYLYQRNAKSWIYILVLIARPQLIINIDYLDYLMLTYSILWIFFLFNQNFYGTSLISLFNSLLKTAVLNFLLEEMQANLGFSIGLFVVIQQFLEVLLIQGTLTVNTINFQVSYSNYLNIIDFILNILLIYFQLFKLNQLLIQILALIKSCFQLTLIISYNNYRNSLIRKIMAFTHLATLVFGIIQFISYQHSYTLVMLPLLLKIILQQQFSNHNVDDPILKASLLLEEGRGFECFVVLNNLKDLGVMRKAKCDQLLKLCIDLIILKISKPNQVLKGVCQQLMKNDEQNTILSNQLNSLIENKLYLLQNIKDINFKQLLNYTDNVNSISRHLEKLHSEQNSMMIQSLKVFFYAEILNDLLSAQQIQSSFSTSQETQIKFNDSMLSKLIYLVANYQNNKLIVKSISSNAPKTFCNKTLDDLIPLGVREWHSLLVDKFVTDGDSKYVRNLFNNYITNENFIENVQFAIDIFYTDEVDFVCLFQPTLLQTKTVIINQNYQITSISQNFSEFVNLSKYFQIGKQIDKFIPSVTQITESCYLENMMVMHSDQILSSQNFTDKRGEMSYYCDVSITVRMNKQMMLYMIIQFDNFKKQLSKKNEGQLTEQHIVQKDTFEKIPYELENTIIEDPYEFQDDQDNRNYQQNYLNIDEKSMVQQQIITPRDEEVSLVLFKRIAKRFKSQFKKSQFQEEQHAQFYDAQSQVSSMKLLRNSKFYRKYELYNKFLQYIPHYRLHKLIIAIMFLLCLFQIIFMIIQVSNMSLVTLVEDINLLEIKNLIFQPIELFLVTRWTLFNYKNQLNEKLITQEEYTNRTSFALSNLDLGYDQLNSNIESVLYKKELQTLLQGKHFYAYQYLDSYKDEQYNMSLRTAIQVLLNFQYTLKMNYKIEKTVVLDSPQAFYGYKNYKVLNDIAQQLNLDVISQTQTRASLIQGNIKTILAINQSLLLFLLLLILILQLIIDKRLKQFINLKQYIDERELELEIRKYQQCLSKIKIDNSFKFQYRLNMELKEQQFQSISNSNIQTKIKFQKFSNNSVFKYSIIISAIYIIFSLNQFVMYFLQNDFLQKYPDTTYYLQGISNLGVDFPCMFAQREVLYERNRIIYLTQEDFDDIYERVILALNNTADFESYQRDFSKILISKKYEDYYKQLEVSNLCDYIPINLKEKSQFLCPQIFNENMLLGLKAVLIYSYNLIAKEIEINKFTQRSSIVQNELDGVFILSQIIKEVNTQFVEDLKDQTNQLVQIFYIINICYIVSVSMIILVWTPKLVIKFINSSKQIVQFIQILPSYSLFTNDQFERILRTFINQK